MVQKQGSPALKKIMKLAKLVVVALVTSVPSFADITACPNPTPGALTPYQPTSATNGCSTIDATFHSFFIPSVPVGQPTLGAGYTLPDLNNPPAIVILGNNTVATPTPAQIFLVESPTNPGRIRFNSPGPATGKSADPATNFCGASSGSGGWCIQGADQSLVSSITYVGNFNSAISIIGLTGTAVSHSSGGSGATAVVYREFCTGTATFDHKGTAATGGTCAEYGVLQGGAINGNFNTLPFNTAITLNASTNLVSFRDTVYLTTSNGTGSFASILSFDLITTPEPATFWLLSSALAGLGFVRFRRKRS